MPDYPQQEERSYSAAIDQGARASAQFTSDVVNLTTSIYLSKPPQVRASVSLDSSERLAEHDVFDAKQMLKEGMSPEEIKIEISHSRVSQECDSPEVYQNCIVNLADRQNILEDAPPIEISVNHAQDLQL